MSHIINYHFLLTSPTSSITSSTSHLSAPQDDLESGVLLPWLYVRVGVWRVGDRRELDEEGRFKCLEWADRKAGDPADIFSKETSGCSLFWWLALTGTTTEVLKKTNFPMWERYTTVLVSCQYMYLGQMGLWTDGRSCKHHDKTVSSTW